jgi:uncharacterized protein (DUF1778 family)
MMAHMQITKSKRNRRDLRTARLGFRLDGQTKHLIERAAKLDQRQLTAFCVAALTDAARRTIAQHDTIALSELDRAAFFNVLLNPPKPSKRLARAFKAARQRVAS